MNTKALCVNMKRLLIMTLIFAISGVLMAKDHENKTDKPFDYKNQLDSFWKENLKGETYQVCRQHGTESPFSGKYDKLFEEGTYYCACCGGDHPVYSSAAKFDSGTGWPSFYEPIQGGVIERPDPNDNFLGVNIRGLVGMARTEVICSRCESHLGHVFNDVPQATGKRYCMNSVVLSFTKKGEPVTRSYEVTPDKEEG